MFSKLLCLIAHYTTFYSATTNLDSFSNITADLIQVHVFDEGNYHSLFLPQGLDDNAAAEWCATRCLSIDYFCSVFHLIDYTYSDNLKIYCRMFERVPEQSQFPEAIPRTGYRVFAAYKIRKSIEFEDIIARFSPEKMSEKEWANVLLNRYGLVDHGPTIDPRHSEWNINMAFLTVCQTAIHANRPRALNFKKWLSGADILASQRNPQELERFSQRKMNGFLKYWAARTPSASGGDHGHELDAIVLAFLALFSEKFRPDITIIYDPVEKVLFIEGDNLHLFISSVDSGDYIIVREHSADTHVPVILSTLEKSNEHSKIVMAMFEQSMVRFHHEYQYSEPRYFKIICNSLDRIEKALSVIELVEDLLNRPPEYEPVHYSIPNLEAVRDAVTAVLFNVYGNPTTLQLNAYRGLRLGNTKLGTVDIITQ